MLERLAPHRQFLIYLGGGLLSAAIDIAIMQLLIACGIGVIAATSAGFVCGLLINYAFHVTFTFKAPASARGFMRYMSVVAFNYLITIACVSLSMWLLTMPLPGKLVSLPIIAVNGYLLGKYWIFKSGR